MPFGRDPDEVLIGRGGGGEVVYIRSRNIARKRCMPVSTYTKKTQDVVALLEKLKQLSNKSPHILTIYDFEYKVEEEEIRGISTDYLHVTMDTEYCNGGDLQSMAKKGRITRFGVCGYVSQVLEGMQYLHVNGIIHRDLKAENVFMTNRDGPNGYEILTIGDPDSAKLLRSETTEEPNLSHFGTPLFVAPEIIVHGRISLASDVWSIGCLIIQLIDGDTNTDNNRNQQRQHVRCKPEEDTPARLMYAIAKGGKPCYVGWEDGHQMLSIAEACLNHEPSKRPTVADLNEKLAGVQSFQQPRCPVEPGFRIPDGYEIISLEAILHLKYGMESMTSHLELNGELHREAIEYIQSLVKEGGDAPHPNVLYPTATFQSDKETSHAQSAAVLWRKAPNRSLQLKPSSWRDFSTAVQNWTELLGEDEVLFTTAMLVNSISDYLESSNFSQPMFQPGSVGVQLFDLEHFLTLPTPGEPMSKDDLQVYVRLVPYQTMRQEEPGPRLYQILGAVHLTAFLANAAVDNVLPSPYKRKRKRSGTSDSITLEEHCRTLYHKVRGSVDQHGWSLFGSFDLPVMGRFFLAKLSTHKSRIEKALKVVDENLAAALCPRLEAYNDS